MEQIGSHWADFHEIYHSNIFRNSFEKIQVLFKFDKNNGNFARRRIYIFDHISWRKDTRGDRSDRKTTKKTYEAMGDLKERRGYSHLKEEALDRTMWTTRFGRGFGPVVKQTTEWMNLAQFIVELEMFHTNVIDKITNTSRLSPRYENKTRGCHCGHWAPDDGWENARNMLSCKQTLG